MSFLAPLFFAGLAALAIPILIHLRRREEKEVVDFPSLMFLRDIPFQSERRKSIKHPILLALRLLALVLLVAAFARPFLGGDASTAAGTLGPRELVVMVDRSWSMNYDDHWNEGLSLARDVLASQGPRDRSTLILFDEGATAPVRSSPSPDELLRALDGAAPSARATRYAPALRLARSVLETSELPRREVVLISDLQASGWSGGENVSVGPGVVFVPRPVGDPEAAWSNASVADVNLRRSDAGERDAVLPTARVVLRGGDEGAGVVAAVLEVDGQVRERVETGLSGGVAEVQFGPVALTDEPQRAVVRLQEDRLPVDDARYFVLSPGRDVSVLIVEPTPSRNNASLYIRRALELSRDPPIRVEVTRGGLPSDLAGRYDVVVLNGVDAPLSELQPFLETGGGVWWAPEVAGTAGEGASAGGTDALPATVGGVRDHGGGVGAVRLGTVDREHPVFQPFRESGTGNFASSRFLRSRRLEPHDSARVLARFDDGSPALVAGRALQGRVMVWAATLDTYWTNLPVEPVFLPFAHRAVLYLADRREEVPARQVGSVIAAEPEMASGEDGADAVGGPWDAVVTPSDERVDLTALPGPLVLEEAGFYELVAEEGEASRPLAVNVNPAEGDLTRRDAEEVVAAVAPRGGSGTSEAGGAGADTEVRTEDLERHQGFWRYLLIAAFLLFVGETVLSNRLSEARPGGAESEARA